MKFTASPLRRSAVAMVLIAGCSRHTTPAVTDLSPSPTEVIVVAFDAVVNARPTAQRATYCLGYDVFRRPGRGAHPDDPPPEVVQALSSGTRTVRRFSDCNLQRSASIARPAAVEKSTGQ